MRWKGSAFLRLCRITASVIPAVAVLGAGPASAQTNSRIVFRAAPRAADAAVARLSPEIVRGEIRRLAAISSGGTAHVLYAAPTTAGSFCAAWTTKGGGFVGGCRRAGVPGLQVLGFGRTPSLFTGSFSQANVARVVVELADRTQKQVPFAWVTRPIAAGLFLYSTSRAERSPTHRPVAFAIYNSNGKVIETLPVG